MSSLRTFKKTFDRLRPDESGNLPLDQVVPFFEAYTRKIGIGAFHPKMVKKEMLKHVLSKNYDDHFSLEDGEHVLRELLGSGRRGELSTESSDTESEPERHHHRVHHRRHRPSFHHFTPSELEDEIAAIYELRKTSSSESDFDEEKRGRRHGHPSRRHHSGHLKHGMSGGEAEHRHGGHSKVRRHRSLSASESDYDRGHRCSEAEGRHGHRSRSVSRHMKRGHMSSSEMESRGQRYGGQSKGRRGRSPSASKSAQFRCPFLDRQIRRNQSPSGGDFGHKGRGNIFDIKGRSNFGEFMKVHHGNRMREALQCPFIMHVLRHHLHLEDTNYEGERRRHSRMECGRHGHGGGRRLSFRVVSSSESER
ncbi:hypothetical protein QR680_005344 [Steinernema hermaphroditum]|uniref:Uncharacterized protein n=1 Tax=Steinernema hermaphroditum TaxID=289476 RepID=A0AA39LUN4_9BILA|nr:hypothetical protein QR680_005344 [Steinernema hermaphroditum]